MNMLTIETERRVAALLNTIAKKEVELISKKKELISNELFNPFICFRAMDTTNKGNIDPYDICAFLKSHHTFISFFESKFLILFYDKDRQEKLSYPNFVEALLNCSEFYSSASDYKIYDKQRTNVLDSTIESLFISVLESELDLIRTTKDLYINIIKRYDYDLIHMFNSLSNGLNFINENSVQNFMCRNSIYLSTNEIKAIINRLGIDKSGNIKLDEFKRIFEVGYNNAEKDNLNSYFNSYSSNSLLNKYIGKFKFFNVQKYEKNEPLQNSDFHNTNKTFTIKSNLKENCINRLKIKPLNEDKEYILYNDTTYSSILPSNTCSIKLDNNSISKKEEDIIVNFLSLLLQAEILIENNKIELCLRADFNVEDAFKIFDINNNGYIIPSEFKYGLDSMSINVSMDDIKILLHKYDLSHKGILNFNDFFDMVIPFQKVYRNDIQYRLQMNYCPAINKADVFLGYTKLYFQNLLRNIYCSEVNINNHRKNISEYAKIAINTIFNKIDIDQKGYIIPLDVILYYI